VYTKEDCLRLTEASEISTENSLKKEFQPCVYDTYEDQEVIKLITSESSTKEKPSQIKSEWRDSEVYRLEETYSLIELRYDPRNFQRGPKGKKDSGMPKKTPKEPEKKRVTKQDLLLAIATSK
jgi:hypothetical protein